MCIKFVNHFANVFYVHEISALELSSIASEMLNAVGLRTSVT